MDILQKLGVRHLINARGPITLAGGSLMSTEVSEAIRMAGHNYVLMEELQQKAGAYVSTLLGVESSYICSGAAGGLLLCAAACITGCDTDRIASLPDTRDWPNEIIARLTVKPNFVYQAMRAAGAKIVQVGSLTSVTMADFEAALTANSVAIQIYLGRSNQPELDDVVALARAHSLKVIVDAAGELPPRRNFRLPLCSGVDGVAFSGGKAIGGPQGTGLILGSHSFISACRMNGTPNKAIGRSLKVSKEDICGLVAALETFVAGTDQHDLDEYEDKAAVIADALSVISGVEVEIQRVDSKSRPNVPRVYVQCLLPTCGCMRELAHHLLEGDPPILVRVDEAGMCIDVMSLRELDVPIICSRVCSALLALSHSAHRVAAKRRRRLEE